MEKFPPIPVASSEGGKLVRCVGRVLPTGQPLFTPATNRACVYFRTTIQKERIEYSYDEDGTRNRHVYWDEVVDHERCSDFWLVDGKSQVQDFTLPSSHITT